MGDLRRIGVCKINCFLDDLLFFFEKPVEYQTRNLFPGTNRFSPMSGKL